MRKINKFLVGLVLVGLTGCGEIAGITTDLVKIHTQTTRSESLLREGNDIAERQLQSWKGTVIPTVDLSAGVHNDFIDLGQLARTPSDVKYNASNDTFEITIGVYLKAKQHVKLLAVEGFSVKIGTDGYTTPLTDVDVTIGGTTYNHHLLNMEGNTGVVQIPPMFPVIPIDLNEGTTFPITFRITSFAGVRLGNIQVAHNTGFTTDLTGIPSPATIP